MTDEPAANLGEGTPASFDAGAASTRAGRVVDTLGDLYWTATYGGQDAFECLVRTVLSQNTSDQASQPAHDALIERYGAAGDAERDDGADPGDDTDAGPGAQSDTDAAPDLARALADADLDELQDVIAPAGLHTRKSTVIVAAAEWVCDAFGGAAAFDAFVRDAPADEVRERLLERHGIGPKTADCVLLFAGGRPGVFPVDTHVHRVARRIGLAPPDADHETVREHLERDVPAEKCGFGHTATIQFGREYCTARSPACLDGTDACPLADECDRVGVDPETGTVVDPADTPTGD